MRLLTIASLPGFQECILDAQDFDLLPVLQVFSQETVGPACERGLEDQSVPERLRHASVPPGAQSSSRMPRAIAGHYVKVSIQEGGWSSVGLRSE
jgi:hypothetical protein